MTDISVTANFIDLISFVESLHNKFPLSLKILCFVVVIYFVESKNTRQDNDPFRECIHLNSQVEVEAETRFNQGF
ncbi:hypothetical protein H6G93_26420 [Nostoc sp. FACHB-973]|nr:hypothetical protein [Nostoc sp. FACHB-973]MBX9255112.1 hypothetical protein [Desmonostoc muscorum CCALA 125]